MNLFEQFKTFLQNENITYVERFGKYSGVSMKVEGNNGIFLISIYNLQEKNSLVCFTEFPLRIKKSKRMRIFEFINSLNEQSLISNYILNEDGFLRVKSSLFSCEEKIDLNTFRRFLYTNFNSLDNHFKHIVCLAEINFSPLVQQQINFN